MENFKPLSELLQQFSMQKNMKKPMLEARVINMWPTIVGNLINKYTEKVFIKNGVLFVGVNQSALKNELQYMQEQILEKINKEIGENFIEKMVLL